MSPSPETMAEKRRVEKALAWAQKRLKTAYHIEVVPIDRSDQDKGTGVILRTFRSDRGEQDKNFFFVDFDRPASAALTMPNLRRIAAHEVIHMALWEVSEWAEKGRKKSDVEAARLACETFTYWCQRLLVGEIK